MTWDYIDKIDLLKPLDKYLYRNPEGVVLPEFYYGNNEKNDGFDAYNGDISGLQINEEGNLLAVWTKNNYIYIYKRGRADDHVSHQQNNNKKYHHNQIYNGNYQQQHHSKNDNESSSALSSILSFKSLSLVDQLDAFLGIRHSPSNNPQIQFNHPDLPYQWTLRMVITPNEDIPDDIVSFKNENKKYYICISILSIYFHPLIYLFFNYLIVY